MKGKDFLSITDLEPDEVSQMVSKAREMKNTGVPRLLDGKTVALIFEKPSLRTRVSFEVGVQQMGGTCIYLSPMDIGELGVREPVSDVARVLDRLVDVIVARVFDHESLATLAAETDIPVVNALSDLAHPCQVLGDLITMSEVKGRLKGLRVAYIGDGNNIASSLALGCASVGADFVIAAPSDYHVPSDAWEEARRRAFEKESLLDWVEDPKRAVDGADVVYTDVWISMGDESEADERRRVFSQYQVNEDLMELADGGAVFMHDMPAHRGEEVSEGILDHKSSVVYAQAENRLHAQNAILTELLLR
ncbi:MAG TPA: ornithine carbamoyltransferase [SAR202 cluster bacterium]|nr:ornithine carbamoyltransferase [SAR202 cluster bacterium]|tara:strand:+ start:5564 stop:6481 length:918 start_codon:yes stop_codon:yes gene_type:complete